MSNLPLLLPSESKVLNHIEMCRDGHDQLIQSTRHIAEATSLSPRTVRRVIDRLNELQLIKTDIGTRTRPSQHRVLGRIAAGADRPPSHANAAKAGAR
jgi:DNA-binding GntR family transcriptional regulator